jgi:hypothetical protein
VFTPFGSLALKDFHQFGVWQRFGTNLATSPQLVDPEEIVDSILLEPVSSRISEHSVQINPVEVPQGVIRFKLRVKV